jgi:hypothetical protein
MASELNRLLVRVETPAITAVYELTVESCVETVVLSVARPDTVAETVAVLAAAVNDVFVANEELVVDTAVESAVDAETLVEVAAVAAA